MQVFVCGLPKFPLAVLIHSDTSFFAQPQFLPCICLHIRLPFATGSATFQWQVTQDLKHAPELVNHLVILTKEVRDNKKKLFVVFTFIRIFLKVLKGYYKGGNIPSCFIVTLASMNKPRCLLLVLFHPSLSHFVRFSKF